ncbi:aldehyde-activating protein [Amylibacter ulvae]|uniref:Aldehyde-activating protein n=1 Tax=Paramylibacter ulvae TaxID=1651968 RepID=A0ABQ3CWM4_9RHOB|nr:GFA family protein [Amylibacter ulvae]GHA47529.1 aldehyde-activating protein [Amylibacter ulvae]
MSQMGQCMCGGIEFTADVENAFGACHCKMCQRWAGGMFMGTHGANLRFTKGADMLAVYESSDWAKRAFCKTCGSSIYYELNGVDGVSISIGTLNNTSALEMKRQFFTDLCIGDVSIANQTDTMISAEIQAKFGV